jgi:hypothetical protein
VKPSSLRVLPIIRPLFTAPARRSAAEGAGLNDALTTRFLAGDTSAHDFDEACRNDLAAARARFRWVFSIDPLDRRRV